MTSKDELLFLPLGGLGEIGMNAALYGFGAGRKRRWILVDCGLSFAGEEAPGVDLVLPDLRFIEEERKNLAGIVITHAHEDHIGALADLWPRLGAPVFLTPFAAGLIEARRLGEPGAPRIDMRVVTPGQRFEVGPFELEFLPVAHSIPEANSLVIRSGLGNVVHSGDWKIDPGPVVGNVTEAGPFMALGREGVLALVSDSTNAIREGSSPSETEVQQTLIELISNAPHRVAVTIFSSNVARIRSVAEAARQCGREVVVVGRAMQRVIDVARELGYLDGVPEFRSPEMYGYLARDRVVALMTGSQGEPRAALSRVAFDDHPEITLAAGDRVIFSSRTIPGNEKAVGRIINALARQNVEVITDRTHLVHVSGHPRRGEMATLYGWLKPMIAIPAHGEALHLTEHAAFARAQGVEHVVRAFNGDMVRLAPGEPEVVDRVPAGRLMKDGNVIVPSGDEGLAERRRLSFAGIATIAIALDSKGEIAGDPEIAIRGMPALTLRGKPMIDVVVDAVTQTLGSLPKARRRDPDFVEDVVARGVRAAVNTAWGKKPQVSVLVVMV
jgi:ribonuclease J